MPQTRRGQCVRKSIGTRRRSGGTVVGATEKERWREREEGSQGPSVKKKKRKIEETRPGFELLAYGGPGHMEGPAKIVQVQLTSLSPVLSPAATLTATGNRSPGIGSLLERYGDFVGFLFYC